MDVIGTMQAIGRFTGRWPSATAKLIEDKANGPAVITMLKNKITGLIAVEPEGGKVSRAYAAQPEVEAGNVFLPHPALHGWVDEFVGRVRRSRMRRTMMMWMRSRRRLSAGRCNDGYGGGGRGDDGPANQGAIRLMAGIVDRLRRCGGDGGRKMRRRRRWRRAGRMVRRR